MSQKEMKKVEAAQSLQSLPLPEVYYSVDPVVFAHYHVEEAICSPELTRDAETLLKALSQTSKGDAVGALQRLARFFKKNEDKAVRENERESRQNKIVVASHRSEVVSSPQIAAILDTDIPPVKGADVLLSSGLLARYNLATAAMPVGGATVFSSVSSERVAVRDADFETEPLPQSEGVPLRDFPAMAISESASVSGAILFSEAETISESGSVGEFRKNRIDLRERENLFSVFGAVPFWQGAFLLGSSSVETRYAVAERENAAGPVRDSERSLISETIAGALPLGKVSDRLWDSGTPRISFSKSSVESGLETNRSPLFGGVPDVPAEIPFTFVGFPFIPRIAASQSATPENPNHHLKQQARVVSRDPSDGSKDSHGGAGSDSRHRSPRDPEIPFEEMLSV